MMRTRKDNIKSLSSPSAPGVFADANPPAATVLLQHHSWDSGGADFSSPESHLVHDYPPGWEDGTTVITSGTNDVISASWYLTRSRIWPLVRSPRWGPVVLGVVLALIIIATVLLSPSADSHFIYTDF